ncbi:MAG: N-formylglutamate amidohydrolase [Rhodobacteraceae bacterium]|nr:N-formylglutamate amidohydrolase [Paracoccaceae bacterium]
MYTNPVNTRNSDGKSRVLLVCEHASNAIPAEYNGLGLSDAEINSHIAWDPGALAVSNYLSDALDATLIAQNVSRLVYDCNRPPESEQAMRTTSEIYRIPGNENLTDAQKQARVDTVYTPFRNAIRQTIDQRDAPVIITIHTFTPIYHGKMRDVEIGILHDSDTRIADAMLAQKTTAYNVQRNQPYAPEDGVTHTLVDQAISRNLANVMIEIRNDLVQTDATQRAVAKWLAENIKTALKTTGLGNTDATEVQAS